MIAHTNLFDTTIS